MLAAQIEVRLTELEVKESLLEAEVDEVATYRNNNINKDTTDSATTVCGDNQTYLFTLSK